MSLYIPIILGTAREGRRSEHAAKFILQEFQKLGDVETELLDVRDYAVKATDNSEKTKEAQRFAEIATRADGFILVVPEYDHGYPGELKMLLDMLYKEYNRKPIGIQGCSNILTSLSKLFFVGSGNRLFNCFEHTLFGQAFFLCNAIEQQ